jgi:hypothetical protein
MEKKNTMISTKSIQSIHTSSEYIEGESYTDQGSRIMESADYMQIEDFGLRVVRSGKGRYVLKTQSSDISIPNPSYYRISSMINDNVSLTINITETVKVKKKKVTKKKTTKKKKKYIVTPGQQNLLDNKQFFHIITSKHYMMNEEQKLSYFIAVQRGTMQRIFQLAGIEWEEVLQRSELTNYNKILSNMNSLISGLKVRTTTKLIDMVRYFMITIDDSNKKVSINRSSLMKIFENLGVNNFGFSTYVQSNYVISEECYLESYGHVKERFDNILTDLYNKYANAEEDNYFREGTISKRMIRPQVLDLHQNILDLESELIKTEKKDTQIVFESFIRRINKILARKRVIKRIKKLLILIEERVKVIEEEIEDENRRNKIDQEVKITTKVEKKTVEKGLRYEEEDIEHEHEIIEEVDELKEKRITKLISGKTLKKDDDIVNIQEKEDYVVQHADDDDSGNKAFKHQTHMEKDKSRYKKPTHKTQKDDTTVTDAMVNDANIIINFVREKTKAKRDASHNDARIIQEFIREKTKQRRDDANIIINFVKEKTSKKDIIETIPSIYPEIADDNEKEKEQSEAELSDTVDKYRPKGRHEKAEIPSNKRFEELVSDRSDESDEGLEKYRPKTDNFSSKLYTTAYTKITEMKYAKEARTTEIESAGYINKQKIRVAEDDDSDGGIDKYRPKTLQRGYIAIESKNIDEVDRYRSNFKDTVGIAHDSGEDSGEGLEKYRPRTQQKIYTTNRVEKEEKCQLNKGDNKTNVEKSGAKTHEESDDGVDKYRPKGKNKDDKSKFEIAHGNDEINVDKKGTKAEESDDGLDKYRPRGKGANDKPNSEVDKDKNSYNENEDIDTKLKITSNKIYQNEGNNKSNGKTDNLEEMDTNNSKTTQVKFNETTIITESEKHDKHNENTSLRTRNNEKAEEHTKKTNTQTQEITESTANIIIRNYTDIITKERKQKLVVKIRYVQGGTVFEREEEHDETDYKQIEERLRQSSTKIQTAENSSLVTVIKKPTFEGKKINKRTYRTYIIKRYYVDGLIREEEQEVENSDDEESIVKELIESQGFKRTVEDENEITARIIRKPRILDGVVKYKYIIITKTIRHGREIIEEQEDEGDENEVLMKLRLRNIKIIKLDERNYESTARVFRRPIHNGSRFKTIVITRTLKDGFEVEEEEQYNETDEEVIAHRLRNRGIRVVKLNELRGRILTRGFIDPVTQERKWIKVLKIKKIKNGTEYEEEEEFEDTTEEELLRKIRLRGITLVKQSDSKNQTTLRIMKIPYICENTRHIIYKSSVIIRTYRGGEEVEYEEIFNETDRDLIISKLRAGGLTNIVLWEKPKPRAILIKRAIISSHHKDKHFKTVAVIRYVRNGILVEEEEEFDDETDEKLILNRLRQRGIMVVKRTRAVETNTYKLVRKPILDAIHHTTACKNVLVTRSIRNGKETIEEDELSESDEEIAIEKLKSKGVALRHVPSKHTESLRIIRRPVMESKSDKNYRIVVTVKRHINGYEIEEEEEGTDEEEILRKIRSRYVVIKHNHLELEKRQFVAFENSLKLTHGTNTESYHLRKNYYREDDEEGGEYIKKQMHLKHKSVFQLGSKKLNKVKFYDDYLMLYEDNINTNIPLSYFNSDGKLIQDTKVINIPDSSSENNENRKVDVSMYQPVIFDKKANCYRSTEENELHSKEDILDPLYYIDTSSVEVSTKFFKLLKVNISQLRRKVAEKLAQGETDIILTAKDFSGYSSSEISDEYEHKARSLINNSQFTLRLSHDLIFNYYSTIYFNFRCYWRFKGVTYDCSL